MKRIGWAILISMLCAAFASAAAPPSRIDIVIPADNPNLRDFSQKIQTTLQQALPPQQSKLSIAVRTRAEAESSPAQGALLIAVGDSLLPWVMSSDNKYSASIAFYVASAQLRDYKPIGTHITALYRDQPLTRQLRLAKLIFPKLRRVAILQSNTNSTANIAQLQQTTGLTIDVATIDDQPDWAKTLSQLMTDNDILLAIDDPKMYNSSTIHSILLTAYRHGKMLVGPSKPFVGAGSLASCYTTTEQYLQQLGDLVNHYLQTEKIPVPQYPKFYQVTINKQVATSLGLTIAEEQTLSTSMQNDSEGYGDGN